MFDTLAEVESAYATLPAERRHQILYTEFERNAAQKIPYLLARYQATEGFGELAFLWNWHLLVAALPTAFRALEIGVYKGRVLGTIDVLAQQQGKSASVVGLTPLSSAADKYSRYDAVDYGQAIVKSFTTLGADINHLTIIHGLSTELAAQGSAKSLAPYDLLFIDGSHDYKDVCHDILTYGKLVKSGGYLVMDDASCLLAHPYGRFLGHLDVAIAARDTLESSTEFEHLFAIGHNRVWRRK